MSDFFGCCEVSKSSAAPGSYDPESSLGLLDRTAPSRRRLQGTLNGIGQMFLSEGETALKLLHAHMARTLEDQKNEVQRCCIRNKHC